VNASGKWRQTEGNNKNFRQRSDYGHLEDEAGILTLLQGVVSMPVFKGL
jgi:hypothetical protein